MLQFRCILACLSAPVLLTCIAAFADDLQCCLKLWSLVCGVAQIWAASNAMTEPHQDSHSPAISLIRQLLVALLAIVLACACWVEQVFSPDEIDPGTDLHMHSQHSQHLH